MQIHYAYENLTPVDNFSLDCDVQFLIWRSLSSRTALNCSLTLFIGDVIVLHFANTVI